MSVLRRCKGIMAKPALPVVSWQVLSPAGPAVAYHVAAVIRDCMYIHGGIDKKGSTRPLNKLYKLDLDSLIWHEVRTDESPALSHHTCIVLQDRYLVIIGGWDGKIRSSKIFIFDTLENKWTFPKVSGFEDGCGLSSHAAMVLGGGSDDIIVMGREGSTKYHRRSGSAWILQGDVKKGYKYSSLEITTASRSGHTMHGVGNNLVLIGGRSDQLIEQHAGFKISKSTPECSVLSTLSSALNSFKPLQKPPCGRKSHVAIGNSKLIILNGGETFDGKCREPVTETFALTLKPNIQWYRLPDSPKGRQGHTIVSTSEKVIIHGGLGPKGYIASDSYELCIS